MDRKQEKEEETLSTFSVSELPTVRGKDILIDSALTVLSQEQ